MAGSNFANVGALTDIHTAQKNPLGLEIEDGAGGKYKYLKGVASCVAGSWVTYDELAVTTLLAANAVGPVAIAMAAIVAGDYGWFCIKSPEGGVSGKAATIAADVPVYACATAGSVDDAAVAGDFVFNAFSRSADSGGLATFQIDRPAIYNNAYLT